MRGVAIVAKGIVDNRLIKERHVMRGRARSGWCGAVALLVLAACSSDTSASCQIGDRHVSLDSLQRAASATLTLPGTLMNTGSDAMVCGMLDEDKSRETRYFVIAVDAYSRASDYFRDVHATAGAWHSRQSAQLAASAALKDVRLDARTKERMRRILQATR